MTPLISLASVAELLQSQMIWKTTFDALSVSGRLLPL
jgi:hypothetical protein